MLDRIISTIRSRSPEEWKAHISAKISGIRQYIQQHGEQAALIGFALGIFIIIFYKLVLFLACLALVGYQLLLIISAKDR